jgi:hypothetical protein
LPSKRFWGPRASAAATSMRRRTETGPATHKGIRIRRSDCRVAASRNQKAIVKLAYAIESAMLAQHRLRLDF